MTFWTADVYNEIMLLELKWRLEVLEHVALKIIYDGQLCQ